LCQVAEHDFLFRKIAENLLGLGELLGGLDYAVVAQRIRRTRSAHNARGRSELIKEMLNV
jgi:hypothetical protein